MSAIISPCGKYRYRLDRECASVTGAQTFAYFGVNPSTADATIDDATVRKWRGFTTRNGGSSFIVGNVFAYRATDVRELSALAPHVARGPSNWGHIWQIIQDADVLVPCWGNSAKVPHTFRHEMRAFLRWLHTAGKPVLHFGLTAAGDPKHPLMLGYDTPLLPLLPDER